MASAEEGYAGLAQELIKFFRSMAPSDRLLGVAIVPVFYSGDAMLQSTLLYDPAWTPAAKAQQERAMLERVHDAVCHQLQTNAAPMAILNIKSGEEPPKGNG